MKDMNKWDKRFMEMADLVSTWSSCFQPNRQVGAVIVKDNRIITTGYNGAPAGIKSCEEKGECLRRKLNIPSGTQHELCFAVHAEQNAVIQAARHGVNIYGATLAPGIIRHNALMQSVRLLCSATQHITHYGTLVIAFGDREENLDRGCFITLRKHHISKRIDKARSPLRKEASHRRERMQSLRLRQ